MGIQVEDFLEAIELVVVDLDTGEIVIGDEEIGMHVLQLEIVME